MCYENKRHRHHSTHIMQRTPCAAEASPPHRSTDPTPPKSTLPAYITYVRYTVIKISFELYKTSADSFCRAAWSSSEGFSGGRLDATRAAWVERGSLGEDPRCKPPSLCRVLYFCCLTNNTSRISLNSVGVGLEQHVSVVVSIGTRGGLRDSHRRRAAHR